MHISPRALVGCKPTPMLMRPIRATFANRIAALGPGLVFLLTVVGTGDRVANAALGAAHGYAFV